MNIINPEYVTWALTKCVENLKCSPRISHWFLSNYKNYVLRNKTCTNSYAFILFWDDSLSSKWFEKPKWYDNAKSYYEILQLKEDEIALLAEFLKNTNIRLKQLSVPIALDKAYRWLRENYNKGLTSSTFEYNSQLYKIKEVETLEELQQLGSVNLFKNCLSYSSYHKKNFLQHRERYIYAMPIPVYGPINKFGLFVASASVNADHRILSIYGYDNQAIFKNSLLYSLAQDFFSKMDWKSIPNITEYFYYQNYLILTFGTKRLGEHKDGYKLHTLRGYSFFLPESIDFRTIRPAGNNMVENHHIITDNYIGYIGKIDSFYETKLFHPYISEAPRRKRPVKYDYGDDTRSLLNRVNNRTPKEKPTGFLARFLGIDNVNVQAEE